MYCPSRKINNKNGKKNILFCSDIYFITFKVTIIYIIYVKDFIVSTYQLCMLGNMNIHVGREEIFKVS